jgi:hypothetical protein
MIRVLLYLPGISKNWVPVDFLLDTGAGTSVVHPLDATTKLGIHDAALRNPAIWPIQRTAYGIGGSSPEYSVPAIYALQHDDGTWARHREDLATARPMPGNQTLPSLLGWDILRHYRVIADWRARLVRLEVP